jgi:hypothetical protein
VDQHFGGTIRTAQSPRDLAVVHPERKAHDQCIAAVIGQVLKVLHDALQLLPALDDPLGAVRCGDRL